MPKLPNETDAQFTARMREKYKKELEQIEVDGLSLEQQEMDNLLSLLLGEEPRYKAWRPLKQILKEYG